MTRDEALQWCVKHVEEWPEGYTPQFPPDGWSWISAGGTDVWLTNYKADVISRDCWILSKHGLVSRTTPCGQSFNELMRDLNA